MTEAAPLALARLPSAPDKYNKSYQDRLNNVLELEKRAAYFAQSNILQVATEQSEAVSWFLTPNIQEATSGGGSGSGDLLAANNLSDVASASTSRGNLGAQATLTFGISDTNAVKIDSAAVADDEYARFTANGLESRSTGEVLSDIGAVGSGSVTTITSLLNTSLVIGRDSDNDIDFGTDDEIIFRAAGADQIKIADGGIIPIADNDIDLGSASYQFKDAYFHGSLEADAITVDGTALNTVIAGVTVTNATNSSHVLVTDNESTNEENLITFVEDATSSTGNVGLEMDGNLTYNPSTGTVTATGFSGNLTGTLQTAAQTNVTSLGTLTALTVDNVNIDGNTIISTDTNGDINITPNGTGKVNITSTSDANTLQLTSADGGTNSAPDMVFDRNSSSPGDNDYLGRVDFQGRNSAGETISYARLSTQSLDVTDGTEDGDFTIYNMKAGTATEALVTKSALVTAPETPLFANHLASATASNDATLALAGYMSDSYDIYDVYIEKFFPATDDVYCLMQLGSGGTYENGSTDYGFYIVHAGTKSSDGYQTDGRYMTYGYSWAISGQSEFNVGNESDEGLTAHIRLYHCRDTAHVSAGEIIGGAYKSVDGYMTTSYLSTLRANFTNAMTDVKVYFSSGNITSGTMHLYGMKV